MKHIYQICFFVLICLCQNALFSGLDNINTSINRNFELYSQNIDPIKNKPKHLLMSTISSTGKKSQVGQVSKKQYEIVNMLWRKSKMDADNTTICTIPQKEIRSEEKTSFTLNSQDGIKHIVRRSLLKFQSPTPSYIEFYYLDEFVDKGTRLDTKPFMPHKEYTDSKPLESKYLDSLKTRTSKRPIFVFHVRNRSINQVGEDSRNLHINKQLKNSPESCIYFNQSQLCRKLSNNSTYMPHDLMNASKIFSSDMKTKNNKTQWLNIYFNDSMRRLKSPSFNKAEIPLKATTIYDKIKFFEIYDNNTVVPSSLTQLLNRQLGSNHQKKTLQNKHKEFLALEYLDDRQNITKKDYAVNISRNILKFENYTNSNSKRNKHYVNKKRNISKNATENYNSNISEIQGVNKSDHQNREKTIVWLKYPYISAYIYEPLSIYCDAAALSSHWLIASGSCLSRRHKSTLIDGRSAYVAYCSDNWWQSDVVAYVRRSLVHPGYHHRDKTQRHYYNIGIIQVISPLINSCSRWAPVSLVSHKITINEKGLPAMAIGWGLDRYKTRYSLSDIPRNPLVAYQGTIFSKSYSNSSKHSISKNSTELISKNIYYLSLPYKEKNNDTSHGSLLLVEGKLMALYLQKGKGQSSETSEHYTGLWRLIPWINEVIRKAGGKDSFSI